MIVDGKQIAADIVAATRAKAEALGRTPRLVAISADFSPATQSYLKIKTAQAAQAGIEMEVIQCEGDVTTEALQKQVIEASESADAVIVQLPLPASVDTQAVLDAIPVAKDADVLSRMARAAFVTRADGALLPPVVGAMLEVFSKAGVSVAGAKAVVVGQGWLVGEPCATWLEQHGATVTVVTRESGNLHDALSSADIIVSGAGSPGLITPEHIKDGVVLIDAGTSESGGAIVGDADPACVDKASVFTPVPGGMGPIAVACLFQNVLVLSHS